MKRLDNKVAIVTGASKGIGAERREAVLEEGSSSAAASADPGRRLSSETE